MSWDDTPSSDHRLLVLRPHHGGRRVFTEGSRTRQKSPVLHAPGTALHSPAPATGRCSHRGTGDCTVTAARSPQLCSLPYTRGTPTRNLHHRESQAQLSEGGENDVPSPRLRTHHPSPLLHPCQEESLVLCSPHSITPPSPAFLLRFRFSISIHTELLTTSPGQIHPAYTALFFCVSVTEPLQLSAHFEMFYASKMCKCLKIQVPRKHYTELPGSTLCRTPWSTTYLRAPV